MSRLVVFGAYGGANIGDEIILHSLVEMLRSRGVCAQIVVIGTTPGPPANSPLEREYQRKGLQFIPAKSVVRSCRALLRGTLLIGGGQLIDDASGARLPGVEFLLALTAWATGGRVKLCGVGLGRVEIPLAKLLYRCLFALSEEIQLRDAISFETAASLSRSCRRRAEVVADLAFGSILDSADYDMTRDGGIVVAVHHAPHDLNDAPNSWRAADVSRLVRRIRSLSDQRVSIVMHDPRPDFDRAIGQEIERDLKNVNNTELRSFATTGECLDFYGRKSCVVSSRMHPIIIGATRGCACVPISGSKKVEAMAKQIGIPTWDLEQLWRLNDRQFKALVERGDKRSIPTFERLSALSRKSRDSVVKLTL